jgi:predicted ATP-grasp superfamily ATP-dependent carboligase
MRIFVGEYVCGGGLISEKPESIQLSLRQEGAAMLRAIVSDLSEVAETVVSLDPRETEISFQDAEVVPIDPGESVLAQWVAAAKSCDAALIVAPESDGVLAKAVAMLRAGGIDVIAGSGDFLRVASDKLLTAKTLTTAGVAHPMYMSLSDRRFAPQLKKCERFVVKPRDGCGTQAIRTFDSFDDARAELEDNMIMQAWMPGQAISISLVASSSEVTFLPAVSQTLDPDTCEYAGGQGPLNDDIQRRATALASRVINAMPPTVRGFIGLDLLLGSRPSEDCVIEVNPRLTTSYVGLRKMIHGNLTARLFDLETGPVSCCTSVDSVRWTPDGQVWIHDAVAEHA